MYPAKSMGIKPQVLDPEAWTYADIARTRGGSSMDNMTYIREMVKSGVWEEVKKIANGRRVKAYRPKRK